MSCEPYTALLEGTQLCCFGAYLSDFMTNYVQPAMLAAGVVASTLSYIVLSQVTESQDRKGFHLKYSHPAHYLLKALTVNSFLFFVTALPHFFYNCTYWPQICGATRGSWGYALVMLQWSCSLLGNDAAHWVSYTLVVFYGIERTYMLHGRKGFNHIYCHMLAIQMGSLTSYLGASRFKVAFKVAGYWAIVAKEGAHKKSIFDLSLLHYVITLAITFTALVSYSYICKVLVCPSTKHANKKPLPLRRSSSTENNNVVPKMERNLTIVYLFISSLFLIHLALSITYDILVLALKWDDALVICDVYLVYLEATNFMLEICELSAACMGFVIRTCQIAVRAKKRRLLSNRQ